MEKALGKNHPNVATFLGIWQSVTKVLERNVKRKNMKHEQSKSDLSDKTYTKLLTLK